jgi:hypothetical protein
MSVYMHVRVRGPTRSLPSTAPLSNLQVWAVAFALQDRHVLCGVSFALALNFKQTLLYYAPAFFFYLLGQCLFQRQRPLLSILQLGAAVAAVFVVTWRWVVSVWMVALGGRWGPRYSVCSKRRCHARTSTGAPGIRPAPRCVTDVV